MNEGNDEIGIQHYKIVKSDTKEHSSLAIAIRAYMVSTGEQRQEAENVMKILGLEEVLTEERVTSILDNADRRFRDWKIHTGIHHYNCHNI